MPEEIEGRAAGSGSHAGTWAAVALAAVVGVALLVWGVQRAREGRLAAEKKATERLRMGLLRVSVEAAAEIAVLRERVHLTGTIRSAREVRVLPEVPGRLERVLARRGRPVEAGQLLAVIETDTLRAMLEQAGAALEVTRAAARQAEVGAGNARSDRRRLKELERSGVATDREIEAAEARLGTAEAQLELARAQVKQAGAAKKLAEIQIEKASVRAPFSGVVADDYLRTPGEMVGPLTPIAHVVDMKRLRVLARASERELPRIAAGLPAEIRVAPHGDRAFRGEVLVAGPTIDPATRTAVVEIAVENVLEDGEYLLRPGMFARVTVTTAEHKDVLAVRAEAVVTLDGKDSVLTVRRDDPAAAGDAAEAPGEGDEPSYTIEALAVSLGIRAGGWVEVTGGLERGELVVISGAKLLTPGVKVHLKADAPGAGDAGGPSPRRSGYGRADGGAVPGEEAGR